VFRGSRPASRLGRAPVPPCVSRLWTRLSAREGSGTCSTTLSGLWTTRIKKDLTVTLGTQLGSCVFKARSHVIKSLVRYAVRRRHYHLQGCADMTLQYSSTVQHCMVDHSQSWLVGDVTRQDGTMSLTECSVTDDKTRSTHSH
jgi:hypothetical protein